MVYVKGCVFGKHHQVAFEARMSSREKIWLELFHCDLCIMNQPSLAGARYVLTFIDVFSRYTWVLFLEEQIQCLLKDKKKIGY
jgi:hypothetical protein